MKSSLVVTAAAFVLIVAVGIVVRQSVATQIEDLRVEQRRLRERVQVLEVRGSGTGMDVDHEAASLPSSAAPPENAGYGAAIQRLERRLEALESLPGRSNEGRPTQAFMPAVPAAPPDSRAVVLDSVRSPQERVEALLALRMGNPQGRTPDVVRAALDLATGSTDESIRADVFRHLKGALTADLAELALRMLSTDGSRHVREEIAETLGPLREDPRVRAALERTAAEDPDEDVRRQARASLEGKGR